MTSRVKAFWRSLQNTPKLRTVLVAANLVVLALPLGGIGALRLYDSQLIRQTEAELIVQGAFVGELYRQAFLRHARAEHSDLQHLQDITRQVTPPAPDWLERREEPESPLQPITPKLDIATAEVRPSAPDPQPAPVPASQPAVLAGEEVAEVMDGAKNVTLSGIRVLDHQGVVVGSTRGELGMSLAHREEVARALQGERVHLLRSRERPYGEPTPALDSIQRAGNVRVFLALPVMEGDRLLGVVVLSRTPRGIWQALYEWRFHLLVAGAVLLLVMSLISGIVTARIARPLRALLQQTERVAAGDRPRMEPLTHPGVQEIDQLARAFAHMSEALQARAELLVAFTRAVSHEFKSPLTSIQGAVELLRDHIDTMTPERRDRFLENIDREVHRLNRLVVRLIDLARAEATSPTTARVNLTQALSEVVARYQADGLNVSLVPGVVPLGDVRIAAELLDTILSNLLDNARLHAGPSPTVTISTSPSTSPPKCCEIILQDDGPGISEGNAPKLFDPFFTTARERGGSGLGLSIARALAVGHGGDLTLEPSSQGARFRLMLRTSPAAT